MKKLYSRVEAVLAVQLSNDINVFNNNICVTRTRVAYCILV